VGVRTGDKPPIYWFQQTKAALKKIKSNLELNFFQRRYFTNQTLQFPMAPLPTATFRVRHWASSGPYDTLTEIGLLFAVFVGVTFLCEVVFGNLAIAIILLPFSIFYVVYNSEAPPTELEITVDEQGLTALITKSASIYEVGVSTIYKWAELKSYAEVGYKVSGLQINWHDEPYSHFYNKEWKKLLQYLRTHFPEKELVTLKKNNYP
jgi:hypothetical protein